MIIGRSGSGKTVFSERLGTALGREVIHLDRLYWTTGWQKVYTPEAWIEKMKELAAGDEWIIDGNYHSTLEIRLARADTVIFFNFSALQSLFHIFMRYLFPPAQVVDRAPGIPDRISWQLLEWTLRYPTRRTLEKLAAVKDKKIYIVRTHHEARALLRALTEPML